MNLELELCFELSTSLLNLYKQHEQLKVRYQSDGDPRRTSGQIKSKE